MVGRCLGAEGVEGGGGGGEIRDRGIGLDIGAQEEHNIILYIYISYIYYIYWHQLG
jgi:hypothetical protein